MFNLAILAIDKKIFDGQADSINVPGADGELTILKNHIPLITYLKKGEVRIKTGVQEEKMDIQGGILEVNPRETTILLNS